MASVTEPLSNSSRRQRMIRDAWRVALLAGLSLWLGGLTFYALIVVPTGTSLWGSVQQGFLTQRVTAELNMISSVVLILLLINAVIARRRSLWLTWIGLTLAQLLLIVQHGRLSAALDPVTQMIIGEGFYDQHRVYLLVTAGQWVLGWSHFWCVIRNWRRE